jgi:hypothetical protein
MIMTSISTVFSDVEIGEPQRFGRLDVFPLFAGAVSAPDFLLLDEALAAGSVEVTETSEAGSVPVLELRSTAGVSILLLDGEELVGAKQNRILNTSVLAPAGRTIQLPVSCVEQGRWRYMSRTFQGSKHALFARARARKAERMAERYKARAASMAGQSQSVAMAFDADQGAIWSDVSDKLSRMNVRSMSAAMKDGFDSYEANLRAFEEALAPMPGQTGAVFALDGRIAGVELLPTESAFRKLFHKLVRSYAIDALEETDRVAPPAPSSAHARAFLAEVATSDVQAAPGVGLGEDLRIEGRQCVGHALMHEGALLHLAAFDRALAA